MAKVFKRWRTTQPDVSIYRLMSGMDGRRPQEYAAADGTREKGVLLSPDEYDELISWWKEQTTPRGKGRRKLHPSLFGNPYKEEFAWERKKIIAAGGKERGATKEAITALAKRHRVEFDTMRKRITGR